MVRSGRHRLPRPIRLIALVVTLLVGAGIVLVTGTATAANNSGRAVLAADPGGDRAGNRDNDRAGRDGGDDGGGDRRRDDDRDDRRKDDDKKDRDNKSDDPDKDRKNDDDEFPGRDKAAPPSDDDFVDITDVQPDDDRPKVDRDGSTGSFVAHCGTNANNHRNSDNFMVTPGKRNGAQHVHDYVGNLSTDAFSDDESLHRAGTTCDRDNKSTFFWPVLRATDQRGDDADEDGGGLDGNFGRILRPATVDLRFLGNPKQKVVPMPDDLTIIMGDAKARTNGPKNANAQWTCTGFENRITDKYPLCPAGSRLVRILEFPSCWDGEHLDSKDHRSHVVYPDEDGRCDRGFKPIPRLRVTLTFDRPNGRNFAVDTFPDQKHDPRTDHSDFMNIAPDSVLDLAADCINSGRNC